MKKRYENPSVGSESVLEQTSLACTVEQEWTGSLWINSLLPPCLTDVEKGTNFFDQGPGFINCNSVPLGIDDCTIVLS